MKHWKKRIALWLADTLLAISPKSGEFSHNEARSAVSVVEVHVSLQHFEPPGYETRISKCGALLLNSSAVS